MKNIIKKNRLIAYLIILINLVDPLTVNSQWIQTSAGMGNNRFVYSLISGNYLFAGTDTSGVYVSTNNGINWTQTSLNNRSVFALAANENNVYAGTYFGYGVYLSTNNGASWSQTSLNDQWVLSLAASGNNIFAGTLQGVYTSTNNGSTWLHTSLNNFYVSSLSISGSTIYAGIFSSQGVYKSTNNGLTWFQTSLNNRFVPSLAVKGDTVYAGTNDYGIYISTNSGTTWFQSSLNNKSVYSITIYGNNIFAGTFQNGVYVSNNGGTNWSQRGLDTITTNALTIHNNYLFAGTQPTSVFRRNLSELIAVHIVSEHVPNSYTLYQNYPNPFNPSTQIKFNIPKAAFVKLLVYDVVGKEIESLVNENLNRGEYSVEWNASQYPSGIYFYKIIVREYYESKKMVIVK